jgi:hypothetical protein
VVVLVTVCQPSLLLLLLLQVVVRACQPSLLLLLLCLLLLVAM